MITPLITLPVHQKLQAAQQKGKSSIAASLDLDRSTVTIEIDAQGWSVASQRYPFMEKCKERTIYYWAGKQFEPLSRYTNSLIKLVPTEWGAPTFEIDGIKMLPTASVSPYADAERKVGLIQPRDKVILDTCGGLGYFAAWCVQGKAERVLSFEKSHDVIWLRSLNPWSPQMDNAETQRRLTLTHGDVTEHIVSMPDQSVDAALHDPPRFGIAGELYSQLFYDQLARVLKPNGKLFHYTGTPNKLTTGRDVPNEVAKRLQLAGFMTELNGDGVLAIKKPQPKGGRGN